MNNEKTSKVAICEKCQSFVLACDAERLNKQTEKEFTELSNIGFTVKIESQEETKKGCAYCRCANGRSRH